ncbi:MAG: hypothetical protein OK422_05740 [Thaumarchaeota archaeon]|nr:hypothetical protein [Nitrososphaerota archaeon]
MDFETERRGISLASAVAVVIVVALAGTYFVFEFSGSSSANSTSTTTTQSHPGLQSTTTPTTNAITLPTASPTGGWMPGLVAKAALGSPTVQSYIRTAFSYGINGPFETSASPIMVSILLNITGDQIVAGNWTTGYEVSDTKLVLLNVTVQFIPPSNYTVVRAWPIQLPGRNSSIVYDSGQQNVIRVVLSNASVTQSVGPAFYFRAVSTFPINNGTYGGDYLVFLFQLNGTRVLGVFVDKGMSAVLKSYIDSRVETYCLASGSNSTICFTSPWSSTSG